MYTFSDYELLSALDDAKMNLMADDNAYNRGVYDALCMMVGMKGYEVQFDGIHHIVKAEWE